MNYRRLTASNRILYDVPCGVCRDYSSGKHYGINACDGCAGFFKRSVRRNIKYNCKSHSQGSCVIDKIRRNQCRACRFTRCIKAGMNKNAVQHERGPRTSTVNRQIAMFLNNPSTSSVRTAQIARTIHHQNASAPQNRIPYQGTNPMPAAMSIFMNNQNVAAQSTPHQQAYPMQAQITNAAYDQNMASQSNVASFPGPNPMPPPLVPPLPYAITAHFVNMGIYPVPNIRGYENSLPVLSGEVLANYKEILCEAAAKTLFLNVKWAKDFRPFNKLSMDCQQYLVAKGWKNQFILGISQFIQDLDVKRLAKQRNINVKSKEICVFTETMKALDMFKLNCPECICVRGMMLFQFDSTDNETDYYLRNLKRKCTTLDQQTIEAERQHTSNILKMFTSVRCSNETHRLQKIHQIKALIENVSSEMIVNLFFQPTVGDIPMERVICDMFLAA